MSNTFRKAAAGTLLLAMFCAGQATAAEDQQQGPNRGDSKASAPGAETVQMLDLADELARYGIAAGDPVAIIEAAKIKKSVPTRALDASKQTEGADSAGTKDSGLDLSADALLERAESMAGGNSALLGLIADARASKSRGAVQGAAVHSDRVLPGVTDNYTLTFRGGEQATVLVSGDGDTDLDLFIYDEGGNLICSDTDASDQMVCGFTPRWTGNFVIQIQNLGRVYNAYQLAVN